MNRRIRRAYLLLVLIAAASAPVLAQDPTQDLLAQARAAIGEPAKLAKVTTLSASANVRTNAQALNIESTISVDVEFAIPGKYRWTVTQSAGAMNISITTAISGDQLMYDDGGLTKMVGLDPAAPGPQRDQMIKTLRTDASRSLLTWLLTPPADGYTFAAAGVAEAPEGKADVLDVKGPDGFALRMFFDTKSHRLLMATQDTETVDIDKQKLQALQADLIKQAQGDIKKAGEVVREALAKLPKKKITVRTTVSDFKKVDGLSLPHQMTIEAEGQSQQDWTIKSFKVNPPLKADRFEKTDKK